MSAPLDRAAHALEALAGELPSAPGAIRWGPQDDPLTGPWLQIHNPGARGALTVGMMAELACAVAQAATQPWPVLVLAGEPGAFCSGGHLGQVRAGLGQPARGRAMADAMTEVLDGLLALPRLVVAWVEGPALGGGAELLTACDHVVCGPAAQVGFVHGRLGVAPGWGGAARLVRRVGAPAALRLLAGAAVLDGPAAVAAGLADRAGDGSALEDFLGPLHRVAPASIRAAKQQVLAASPVLRQGSDEARYFAALWGSEEHLRRLGP